MLANYSTIDAVTNAVCAGSYQPYKIKLTNSIDNSFPSNKIGQYRIRRDYTHNRSPDNRHIHLRCIRTLFNILIRSITILD